MSTFALIKNNRCPNMEPAWYLKLDSLDLLFKHQERHAGQYWHTTWADPHFEAALQKGDAVAVVRHPMNLLPKRAAAMARAFLREGAIYVNRVGGWMFLTDSQEVLEECEAKAFPEKQIERTQFVYIHKWPLGNHYYLVGWPYTLIFSSDKFNTYEEALAEARRHVPEDRIRLKESEQKFTYPIEGD